MEIIFTELEMEEYQTLIENGVDSQAAMLHMLNTVEEGPFIFDDEGNLYEEDFDEDFDGGDAEDAVFTEEVPSEDLTDEDAESVFGEEIENVPKQVTEEVK